VRQPPNALLQMGADLGQSALTTHPQRFPLKFEQLPLQQSLSVLHGAW